MTNIHMLLLSHSILCWNLKFLAENLIDLANYISTVAITCFPAWLFLTGSNIVYWKILLDPNKFTAALAKSSLPLSPDRSMLGHLKISRQSTNFMHVVFGPRICGVTFEYQQLLM